MHLVVRERGDVGPQHDEFPVSQVDNVEDSEDDHEAQRRKQQEGNVVRELVEKIDTIGQVHVVRTPCR